MEFAVRLDQPDVENPRAGRRLALGPKDAPVFAILNGRADHFEGGADEPELSLKWLAQGRAEYVSEQRTYRLSGTTQLLLNRGQPYRMRMQGESFVIFFPRAAVDAAWQAHSGCAEAMPEIPTLAAAAPASLQAHLAALRDESRASDPSGAVLVERACAVMNEIAGLAFARRARALRLPVIRKTTRDELLRRLMRAETYLLETGAQATLADAARAAALSPFHLIRVFDAAFGETPLAWATAQRLARAHDALTASRASIADIAQGAGYASRTAFDRAFARRYGTTPGALRAH
jgi:AraC-like DNA-binding protein